VSEDYGHGAENPADFDTDITGELAAEAPAWRRLAVATAAAVVLVGVGVGLGYNLGKSGQPATAPVIAPIERLTAQRTPRDILPDLVDNACPSLVRIDPPGGPAKGRLPAIGLMVSADGAVLASLAAISARSPAKPAGKAAASNPPAALQVTIHLPDGRAVEATPIATDTLAGLALLRVDASRQSAIRIGEGDFPRIGTFAFSLAMLSGNGCLVAPGVISADFAAEGESGGLYTRFAGAPQRWAAGAPVLGADGTLMGLILPAQDSAKGRRDTLPREAPGRLLPASVLAQFVTQSLHDRQTPSRVAGLLAIDLDDTLAERLGVDSGQGAAVVAVDPASAAAHAGLQPGDVISAVAGRPIANAAELGRALAAKPNAGPVPVSAIRGGARQDLTITLP